MYLGVQRGVYPKPWMGTPACRPGILSDVDQRRHVPCESAEVWGRASRVAARTPALLDSSPWAATGSCLLDRPMHSCCSSGSILNLHT